MECANGENVSLESEGLTDDTTVWQPATLGELVNVVRGRSYRSSELKDDSDTALVTLKSFQRGGGYRFDGLKPYVGQYNAEQIISPGEIVVAQTDITQDADVIGRPAVVPRHPSYRNLVASLDAAIVRNAASELLDYGFLYYRLLSRDYAHHVVSRSTGTTVLHLSKDALPSFEFLLPPRPEQRRIAEILGALDDKIELNRRVNETLEQMARAQFKSWFVDFDPVRAKMDGQWRRGESLPGLSAGMYDLFPDQLVPSELGEIPEGWAVQPLGSGYDLTMGQSPPGSTYNEVGDGLPFFQGNADFGFRYPSNRRYCTSPTRTAESDDTLVSVRAPVGAINMAWERCCIGRGLSALRHKSGSSSFTYYAVAALQSEIQQYEHTGTVFGSINKRQFESLPTLEPPSGVVTLFHKMVFAKDAQIKENVLESRTLGTLRDSLLPNLVGGNLRISDESRMGQA